MCHPNGEYGDMNDWGLLDREQNNAGGALAVMVSGSSHPSYYAFLTSARWLWVIYLLLGGAEGLILIRVAFRAALANPDSIFTSFIYLVTGLLVLPFHGVLAEPLIQGALIDIPSLVAFVVYVFLAWAITRMLWLKIAVRQS